MDWKKILQSTKALFYYLITRPIDIIKKNWNYLKKTAHTTNRPIVMAKLTLVLTIVAAIARRELYIIIFGLLSLITYSMHVVYSGEHFRKWKERRKQKYKREDNE